MLKTRAAKTFMFFQLHIILIIGNSTANFLNLSLQSNAAINFLSKTPPPLRWILKRIFRSKIIDDLFIYLFIHLQAVNRYEIYRGAHNYVRGDAQSPPL
jgi:hypothetical protein